LALCVGSAVDVKNVCVEELASLDRGSVGRRMCQVILALRRAIIGAKINVESSLAEDLSPQVRITSKSIWRSIDSAVSKVCWLCVARRSRNSLVHVAIRARDHNFEAGAELTFVCSAVGCDRRTIIGTLHSRHRPRIGAASTRFKTRIPLEVDVDRATACDLIAAIGTLDCVILRECRKAEVAIYPECN
jgi:hypothetical protein